MQGTTLANRYRLDNELGRGAMGVVYRAHDTVLNRAVAVKLLLEAGEDSGRRIRLLREARLAAQLNHPNIVAVYDAGETTGVPFLVMELVEGLSLRQSPAATATEALDIALQLCAALEHAHHAGIIHRDLKPENVLITRADSRVTVKLTDLGLSHSQAGVRITQDGTLLGTPLYMAPEQAIGLSPDGRADLYSLGVLLYEMLCGRPPFTGSDALMIVAAHLHAPVVPPRSLRRDIPVELETVILRLLAKDAGDRYADAAELGLALAACQLLPANGRANGGSGGGGSTDDGTTDDRSAGDGSTDPAAAGGSDSARLLDILARGHLVGRRTELQRLREHWIRAAQGQGQLVLISGEPGVGKTRLARELLVYARLSGATALSGGCYEFEATTPYLPFREVLRSWVHAQSADTLREQLGADAAELARLAPEIEQKLGPLPPSPPLSPAEERFRLFETLARFFEARAAGKGLLLWLDDLHWSDPGTLSLLQFLMRRLRDARFMVLGAYREAELDRKHPLATALVDWNRERLGTRVPLDRLTAEETGALLATLLDQESVSEEMVEAMQRETGGNPFFLEEVIKALIEQGEIYRAGGEWHRKSIAEMSIPQSVKEAIGRRLNRLSAGCTEALQAAAALGKAFEFGDLSASLAGPEDELITALEEAETAQLIRSEGGERFVFTHDKIREVLYLELSAIRRRRLHQRIGEALEKLHEGRPAEHVADLAYHFGHSGDLTRALDYSERAARAAEAIYALEEAVNHTLQALECARSLKLDDRVIEIHRRAGRLLRHRGHNPAAAEHFREALALNHDPARRSELLSELGDTVVDLGDRSAIPLLDEAIATLDADSQRPELAQALIARGRFHHHHLQHRQSLELLQRAVPLAETSDDLEVHGRLLTFVAGAYQQLARLDDTIAVARQCVALGEERGSLVLQAGGHEFIAEGMALKGLWRESLAAADLDEQLGRKCGDLSRVAWSNYSRALAHAAAGRLEASADAARLCGQQAAELGEARLGHFALAQEFESDLLRGVPELDSAPLEAALQSALQTGLPMLVALLAASLSQYHQRAGNLPEARRYSDRILAIIDSGDNRIMLLNDGPKRLRLLLEQGELTLAAPVAQELLSLALAAPCPIVAASTRTVLGRLALAADRLPEAEAAFDQAVAEHEKLDTLLDLGRALRYRAQLRLRSGRHAEARADRQRARELLTQTGAGWELASLAADELTTPIPT